MPRVRRAGVVRRGDAADRRERLIRLPLEDLPDRGDGRRKVAAVPVIGVLEEFEAVVVEPPRDESRVVERRAPEAAEPVGLEAGRDVTLEAPASGIEDAGSPLEQPVS